VLATLFTPAPRLHPFAIPALEAVTSVGTTTEIALEATTTPQEPRKPQDAILCSCIKFARTLVPQLPKGDAKDLIPNSRPEIGGIVIFHYPDTAHIAVIQKFTNSGMIVAESNYHRCKKDTRYVDFTDPAIFGYWSQAVTGVNG